jgi:tRNA1Val (adenine37-N6)-methyltransferase
LEPLGKCCGRCYREKHQTRGVQGKTALGPCQQYPMDASTPIFKKGYHKQSQSDIGKRIGTGHKIQNRTGINKMKSLTTDSFFKGCIQVKQNRSGYRFSLDAVLLAWHADPGPNDTILDLGTGCGIIPMILAYRNPEVKIYGIEVQTELADIANLNIAENGMEDRISILCRDMKTLTHKHISGPVDLAVSNPPFRKSKSGRINPNQQRAIARHEIKTTLYDVVETACRMLITSGRFVMIYPAGRITDLLTQMRASGIEPKSIRMVHSGKNTKAKMILVEGKKGGRSGLKIDPPLFIYQKNGSYSEEVENIFKP